MWDLTADQKANLALIASVVVPLLIVVIQAVGHRLKPKAKSERFKENVLVRTESGPFDRPQTHYVVNPAFIRRKPDGSFVVPGLGHAVVQKEDLIRTKEVGGWLDMIDCGGIGDAELYLRPVGTTPAP